MEGERRLVTWSRGVRVAVRASDKVVDLPPTRAGQIDLGAVAPVRGQSAWQGRRAYSGSWWVASLRRSVEFASLTERDTLLLLDSTHRVVAVTARPVSIRWPEEAGLPTCKPCFFVRYSDGNEELICSRVPDHQWVLELQEATGWRLRTPPRVGTILLELRQQRQTLHVSLLALLNPSSVQTTHLAHWQSIAEAVFTRDPSAIEERFDEVHAARLLALDQIWSLIARLSLVAKNKHALVATLPLTWRDPNSTDHAYINAARAEFGVPPLPLVFRS